MEEKLQWMKIDYMTADGERSIVARVGDFEKNVLSAKDSDFVRLRDVRWYDYEVVEEEDDETHCDCGCSEEHSGEPEIELSEEDKKLVDELVEGDDDDDVDFDDSEEVEVLSRQEDDVLYGLGSDMYLKRDMIVSFAPIRGEYAEVWDQTLDMEESD
jgi:hypothetical protein